MSRKSCPNSPHSTKRCRASHTLPSQKNMAYLRCVYTDWPTLETPLTRQTSPKSRCKFPKPCKKANLAALQKQRPFLSVSLPCQSTTMRSTRWLSIFVPPFTSSRFSPSSGYLNKKKSGCKMMLSYQTSPQICRQSTNNWLWMSTNHPPKDLKLIFHQLKSKQKYNRHLEPKVRIVDGTKLVERRVQVSESTEFMR